MLSKVHVSKKSGGYFPSIDIQRKWLTKAQKEFDLPFDVSGALTSYEQTIDKSKVKIVIWYEFLGSTLRERVSF